MFDWTICLIHYLFPSHIRSILFLLGLLHDQSICLQCANMEKDPRPGADAQVQVQDPGMAQAVRFSFARQEPYATVISPRRPDYSILHHARGILYPQDPEVDPKDPCC